MSRFTRALLHAHQRAPSARRYDRAAARLHEELGDLRFARERRLQPRVGLLTLATTLRWRSVAPLATPVVPPVYCRNATSSGPISTGRSVISCPMESASLNGVAPGNDYCRHHLLHPAHDEIDDRAFQDPSRSPIDATTTCFTAVRATASCTACAKFSRTMMASAPQSLS